MIYRVVLEDAPDGGVGAYLPDMPGVAVVGESRAEALQLIDQALQWHVEAMIEDGTPLPVPAEESPSSSVVMIDRVFVEHVGDIVRRFVAVSSNATPFWVEMQSSPLHIYQPYHVAA